jgi:phosphotransferase system  glucose/maltose/N-acetylglucosamine-specific IIC component
VGAARFAATFKADGDLTVGTQRESTGCLGPLLCGGFAGTIVTCLWLVWAFLTVEHSGVGPGAFFPGARGMVVMSVPPLAILGFVAGAVIGVIVYGGVRAIRGGGPPEAEPVVRKQKLDKMLDRHEEDT